MIFDQCVFQIYWCSFRYSYLLEDRVLEEKIIKASFVYYSTTLPYQILIYPSKFKQILYVTYFNNKVFYLPLGNKMFYCNSVIKKSFGNFFTNDSNLSVFSNCKGAKFLTSSLEPFIIKINDSYKKGTIISVKGWTILEVNQIGLIYPKKQTKCFLE